MFGPRSVASLFLAILAQAPAFSRAADPPYDASVFRGGPARTGDLGAIKLPDRGEVIWRVDIEKGAGDPVVADGVVYLAGGNSSLFAIRADGSAILWQDDRPGRRAGHAPLVVGDRVYLASSLGLSAHDRADGKMIWEYEINGGAQESSPLIAGGKVVVAGSDGFVHAVDPATGAVGWKHEIARDAPDPPPGFDGKQARGGNNPARPVTMASDGSTLFLPIFDQSRIVALDAATGRRRWSFSSKGWTYAEPTVAGDDLFFTSQDKKLYCLDKATGKPRWDFATKWRVESGVAVRDGSAYFGSCDGFFYRVDIKTGQQAWAFETAKGPDGKHLPIYSSPIIDADAVCFGSFDGFAYALRLDTGAVKWKVRPVDGAEVCSSPCTDGQLVFLSVRYDKFKKKGADAVVAIGVPPR